MIFEVFGTAAFQQNNVHKKILNSSHRHIFSKIFGSEKFSKKSRENPEIFDFWFFLLKKYCINFQWTFLIFEIFSKPKFLKKYFDEKNNICLWTFFLLLERWGPKDLKNHVFSWEFSLFLYYPHVSLTLRTPWKDY